VPDNQVIVSVDFGAGDARRSREWARETALATLTLWTLLAALANGSKQLPAVTRARPWIVVTRHKARPIQHHDRELTIFRVGIVGAFDAELDRICAIAASARDAAPVCMWWSCCGVSVGLIQRAIISDDEIAVVIDSPLDKSFTISNLPAGPAGPGAPSAG
jgi:hypothetical protein